MNFNIEHIGLYLKDEEALKNADATALKNFVEQYPYSGLLQLLYCKYLHLNNDINLEQQLEKCALVVNDRKRVYELLFQPALKEQLLEEQNSKNVSQEPVEEKTQEDPQLEIENTESEIVIAEEKQETIITEEKLPKVEEIKEKEQKKTLDELEQNILTEAVNASIQVDISEYQFEDQQETSETTNEEINENTDTEEQKRSFVNWFDKTKKTVKKKKSTSNLIDDFLKDSKNKEKIKPEVFSPSNMAKMSLVSNNQFVTETLATIYAKQGQIDKAIEIYQQLSLKNPEKKTFFASRIRFLKEKQQHNK